MYLKIVSFIFTTTIPALAGLYSFWSSCKKDGFDQEKAFDLLLFGSLCGLSMGLVLEMLIRQSVRVKPTDINVFAVVFIFIAIVCLTALYWRWSLYRVLDNLAVALILSVAFWLVGKSFVPQVNLIYMPVFVGLFICYALIQRYRLVIIKSGFTFCLIGGVFCLISIFLSQKIYSLIFIGLLAILIMAVLIFRLRSLYGRDKKNGRTSVTA